MVDLHIHSNLSDGELSINEICHKAKQENVRILSVVDHDNIDSIKCINDTSEKEGLIFIPGIEMSTESYYLGYKKKVHILGYGYNSDDSTLNKNLHDIFERRSVDNGEYIKKIIDLFSFLDEDMFLDFNYGKYGWIRKLILKHIDEKISPEDIKTLEHYLQNNYPIYHGYNFRVEEAIEMINNAGGYSFIAHPQELALDDKALDSFINYLVECGAKGIESYHNCASDMQSEYYHYLSEKYDLLESGGSDFHRISDQRILGCQKHDMNEESPFIKKMIKEKKIIGELYE